MLTLKTLNIQRYLKKITNSQTLSKSIVNKELLKYLVDQTIKGENPKEFQIAFDVFGKRGESDKEKNIRVYIHNLRKKLTAYYENEGASDEIQFEIPKGRYEIKFNINRKAYIRTRFNMLSPYILVLSLILLIISSSLFYRENKPTAAKQFIWKDLGKSKYPTLIVLGDHYFFNGLNPMGSTSIMRRNNINSEEDFKNLLIKNPHLKNEISTTEQTYINKQAPFGLYKIMTLLGGGHTNIDLKFSSEFRWEDTEKKNVIFIGSFKTQNKLKKIHEKIGVEYQIDESIIHFHGKDSVAHYKCKSDGFLSIEYPTITRFITADNRNFISFMSNKDVGSIGLLKYLSEPENLKYLEQLTEQFSSPNFKAVLEVKGEGQTDFELALKDIAPITINVNEIWPK